MKECTCKNLVAAEDWAETGKKKVCAYKWLPRSLDPPARCPKCQSRNWDRDRQIKGGKDNGIT